MRFFAVVVLLFAVSHLATAAITIERARYDSPDIDLKGDGAVPSAQIRVNGVVVGSADGTGSFDLQTPFSAPADCSVTITDGTTSATTALEDCVPFSSGAGGVCTDLTNSRTFVLGLVNYKLDWAITCADQKIRFTIDVTGTTGWVGLGFNSLPQMTGADIIMSSVSADGNTVIISDRQATDRAAPGADTVDNLINKTGSLQTNGFVVSFERQFDTGDAAQDMILAPGPIYILHSYASSRNFAAQHSRRDVVSVDLFAAGTPPSGSGTTASTSDETATCVSGPNTFDLIAGKYTLDWTIDCDTEEIAFGLVVKTTGWVGLGFGTDANMADTDIVMGFADGTNFEITDRYATSRAQPVLDTDEGGVESLTALNGKEVDGVTILNFTRKFNTGDSADTPFVVGDQNLFILYSLGPSDNIASQHVGEKGAVKIDLFSGDVSRVKVFNYRSLHGILMVIAWSFSVILGQFLARYLKNIGVWWFHLHRGLNYAVLILTVVSFIIIVYHVDTFYASPHHIMGLFVLFGSLAQPILGYLADKWWSPTRGFTPIFPDKVHWWLGRLTIAVALVNIFLGFCEYQVNTAVWVIYGIWLAIYIAVMIYTEVRAGQVNHNNMDENSEMQVSGPSSSSSGGVLAQNKVALIPFFVLVGFGAIATIIICIGIEEFPLSKSGCALPRA